MALFYGMRTSIDFTSPLAPIRCALPSLPLLPAAPSSQIIPSPIAQRQLFDVIQSLVYLGPSSSSGGTGAAHDGSVACATLPSPAISLTGSGGGTGEGPLPSPSLAAGVRGPSGSVLEGAGAAATGLEGGFHVRERAGADGWRSGQDVHIAAGQRPTFSLLVGLDPVWSETGFSQSSCLLLSSSLAVPWPRGLAPR